MKKIIVIGSGAAAAVLSRQLLANGNHEISMFEAGPGFKPGDRRIWLDHLVGASNLYEDFIDEPGTGHKHMSLRGTRLFLKGGTTNHWTGLAPRFKPEDFQLNTRTGIGVDWPISYEDLAPYYTKAEALLGITGDSDIDDPPRYGDRFPFAPPPFTFSDGMLINVLKSLGISYGHAAIARNGDRCITTGTCEYCPMNARYTALYDLVQLQSDYGDSFELRTESPVTKILMDGKKHARGVEFLNLKTGGLKIIEADAVVISCGTIESTKLLLASTDNNWSNGIGNDSDHVGRHLLGHPLMHATGTLKSNPEKISTELGFASLLSRHFDSPKYQAKGKMWFTAGIGSNASIEKGILSNLTRGDIDKKITDKAYVTVAGEMEMFDSHINRISLGSAKTRLGLPDTKIEFEIKEVNVKARQEHADTFAKIVKAAGCKESSIETGVGDPDGAHASGTCRMSKSDTDGVVNPDLQVHGTDNLYVCSNAVFPSIAAANPTLTLSALAVRLADHMSA